MHARAGSLDQEKRSACRTLIRRDERFAGAAVGRILREISKHDEALVLYFVEQNLLSFTTESLANALKYSARARRDKYLQRLWEGCRIA